MHRHFKASDEGVKTCGQPDQHAQTIRMPTHTRLRQPPWTDETWKPYRGLYTSDIKRFFNCV